MKTKYLIVVTCLLAALLTTAAESAPANMMLAKIVVPPSGPLPEPAPPPSEQQCPTQPTFSESLDKIINESSLVVAAQFTGGQMEMPRQNSESGLFSVRQLLAFDKVSAIKGVAPEKLYVAPVRAFQFQKGMRYLLFLREVKLPSKARSELNIKSDSVFVLRVDSHILIK